MNDPETKVERENFGSRLGFILVSAGCAIGIGNVWKFPYLCGQYGGAAFILIYLAFLAILGIPMMVAEFTLGRGSRRSVAKAFDVLEPEGTRWHHAKWISVAGCVILMMYYTMVAGWMAYYCFRGFRGDFVGESPQSVTASFDTMMGSPSILIGWTIAICVIGFAIVYIGLQKGVENVSKAMMIALLVIMVILAIHSIFLEGAGKGIRFYLVPDFANMKEQGIFNVIFAAMSQAFFTLSVGNGAMLIFGSHIKKERSLTGEAVMVTALDTFVALMAGFIVIPACFAFGLQPDAGPSLIFITIPNLFSKMPGGQLWGGLFFLFLTFAALSTVIAVFENIISFDMDLTGSSRHKATLRCAAAIIVLSMPAVLGFNVLHGIQPMGEGTSIMDMEDFLVSNNLLPLGALSFALFCTRKNGWGWENFIKEADEGKGIKFPDIRFYVAYIIPAIIIVIYIKGYYDMFHGKSAGLFVGWMIFAIVMVAFVIWCATGKAKEMLKKENK
ncbi:MAG: sodium-dependent transporter [Anaerovoracaceae bacterium]|nr:sodium-dependent transporter [Bacillota bacterium]MDY2671129.1 sodium-dependent transporter [Anaerovoracaceae bacterium]